MSHAKSNLTPPIISVNNLYITEKKSGPCTDIAPQFLPSGPRGPSSNPISIDPMEGLPEGRRSRRYWRPDPQIGVYFQKDKFRTYYGPKGRGEDYAALHAPPAHLTPWEYIWKEAMMTPQDDAKMLYRAYLARQEEKSEKSVFGDNSPASQDSTVDFSQSQGSESDWDESQDSGSSEAVNKKKATKFVDKSWRSKAFPLGRKSQLAAAVASGGGAAGDWVSPLVTAASRAARDKGRRDDFNNLLFKFDKGIDFSKLGQRMGDTNALFAKDVQNMLTNVDLKLNTTNATEFVNDSSVRRSAREGSIFNHIHNYVNERHLIKGPDEILRGDLGDVFLATLELKKEGKKGKIACIYCGRKNASEIDHYMSAIVKGTATLGIHTESFQNLVPSCSSCHRAGKDDPTWQRRWDGEADILVWWNWDGNKPAGYKLKRNMSLPTYFVKKKNSDNAENEGENEGEDEDEGKVWGKVSQDDLKVELLMFEEWYNNSDKEMKDMFDKAIGTCRTQWGVPEGDGLLTKVQKRWPPIIGDSLREDRAIKVDVNGKWTGYGRDEGWQQLSKSKTSLDTDAKVIMSDQVTFVRTVWDVVLHYARARNSGKSEEDAWKVVKARALGDDDPLPIKSEISKDLRAWSRSESLKQVAFAAQAAKLEDWWEIIYGKAKEFAEKNLFKIKGLMDSEVKKRGVMVWNALKVKANGERKTELNKLLKKRLESPTIKAKLNARIKELNEEIDTEDAVMMNLRMSLAKGEMRYKNLKVFGDRPAGHPQKWLATSSWGKAAAEAYRTAPKYLEIERKLKNWDVFFKSKADKIKMVLAKKIQKIINNAIVRGYDEFYKGAVEILKLGGSDAKEDDEMKKILDGIVKKEAEAANEAEAAKAVSTSASSQSSDTAYAFITTREDAYNSVAAERPLFTSGRSAAAVAAAGERVETIPDEQSARQAPDQIDPPPPPPTPAWRALEVARKQIDVLTNRLVEAQAAASAADLQISALNAEVRQYEGVVADLNAELIKCDQAIEEELAADAEEQAAKAEEFERESKRLKDEREAAAEAARLAAMKMAGAAIEYRGLELTEGKVEWDLSSLGSVEFEELSD